MAQKISSSTPLIKDTGDQESSCSLSSIVSKILQVLKRIFCCCCSVDDAEDGTSEVHYVSTMPKPSQEQGASVIIGQAFSSSPRTSLSTRTKRPAPSLILPEILLYQQTKDTFSVSDLPHAEIREDINISLKSLTEEEMINSNFMLYESRGKEMHSAIIGQVNADLPRQHVVINGSVFQGKAEEVEGVLKHACGISQDSGADQNIDLILTLIQQGIYGGFTNKLFSFPLIGKEGFFSVSEAGEIPHPLRKMNVNVKTTCDPMEIRMDKLFKFANDEGEILSFVNIGISFQIPKDGSPVRCQWDITPIDPSEQFEKWEAEFPQLKS